MNIYCNQINENLTINNNKLLIKPFIHCFKRLREEYKELSNNPLINLGITVGLSDKNNLLEWRFTLIGAKDTPYNEGFFYLQLTFSKDYPNRRPELNFLTPIYHLNVNPRSSPFERLGHVSFSTINCWNPHTSVRKLLHDLYTIFYRANPESCYDFERGQEYKFNRILYEKKVRYFVLRYAHCNFKAEEMIGKISWDFSFNENNNINTENKDKKNTRKNNDKNKEDKHYYVKENSTDIKDTNNTQNSNKRNDNVITKNNDINQVKDDSNIKQKNTEMDDKSKNKTYYGMCYIKFDTGDNTFSISCRLNEYTNEVINRFCQKYYPSDTNRFRALYIYKFQRLIDYNTLEENGIRDGSTIDVISGDVLFA